MPLPILDRITARRVSRRLSRSPRNRLMQANRHQVRIDALIDA
ncbi:oxidoreductase, partial [Burkholderia multivorans]